MALSYVIRDRGAMGDLFTSIVDITCDNNYPAGGWTLDVKQAGFGTNGAILRGDGGIFGGFLFEYNHSTGKLMCRDGSGAANAANPEITTVTAVNGVVVRMMLFGRGRS